MNTHQYVRPLTTRELFSSAYVLYKKHFGKFFLINLVQVIVILFSGLFAFASGFMGGAASSISGNPLWRGVSILIGTLPSIIGIFVAAAMLIAISNAVLGRPVKVRNSFRRAWSAELIVKMLIVSIPFSVLTFILTILLQRWAASPVLLCLVPIEIALLSAVSIVMAFISPVAVLEKKGVIETVRRLFSLFWGNVSRLFINYGLLWFIPIYLLTIVLAGSIATPLGLSITQGIPDPQVVGQIMLILGMLVGMVIRAPIDLFLAPFGTLLAILLYYDTRARKENYNETLLAEEMGYETIGEMI